MFIAGIQNAPMRTLTTKMVTMLTTIYKAGLPKQFYPSLTHDVDEQTADENQRDIIPAHWRLFVPIPAQASMSATALPPALRLTVDPI